MYRVKGEMRNEGIWRNKEWNEYDARRKETK
jgi:hypothetical protein